MSTKPAPTPDLLGEVVKLLQDLPPREIDALAVQCGVTSPTIKNIRDERPGRFGPSYQTIAKLHQLLMARAAA